MRSKSYRTCAQCKLPTMYYEAQDRFGCPECDLFSEEACKCEEADCSYSRNSTDKPSDDKHGYEDLRHERAT